MKLTLLQPTSERIKPLHGLCNGPLSAGGMTNLTEEYREIGVPAVRLHDTDWPYPPCVDVYQIFRDFSKDENDPANYDFLLTDQYLAAIHASGAEIVYRLGTSIEHIQNRRFVYAPQDNAKWARVAEKIIRHYNEGWADGYHYNIRFWEIWNEPEDLGGARKNMWIGTQQQFYAFYAAVSRHLKNTFGDAILVGGYASSGFHEVLRGDRYLAIYFEEFLKYIRQNDCPLEFFSYHYYGNQPEVQHTIASFVRKTLDEAGYPQALILLDEWNASYRTPQEFADLRSMKGACFVGKMFCALQNTFVDLATYYDAQPHMKWCGLFNRDVVKQKPYFVFKAFGRLYRLGERVGLSVDDGPVAALAASDGRTTGIFLINDGEEQTLSLSGREEMTVTVTVTDENDDERVLAGLSSSSPILLPARSVIYMELTARI